MWYLDYHMRCPSAARENDADTKEVPKEQVSKHALLHYKYLETMIGRGVVHTTLSSNNTVPTSPCVSYVF